MTTRKPQPTAEQRADIVQKALKYGTEITAKKYDFNPSTVWSWIRLLKDGCSLERKQRKEQRKPTLERYLQHMADNTGHTQAEAARALGLSRQRINQLQKMLKDLEK